MIVIGIDIGKDIIVVVSMDDRPADPRQFYRTCSYLELERNADDLARLLALAPNVAVMEPTGINYLKLWENALDEAGVEIKLVGHKEASHYRESTLQLPDKDDLADAIALGCYYFDSQHPGFNLRFVPRRDKAIVQLRELVLRLGHLARVQNPIINRIRQDLAWQFPEAQNKTLDATLFWDWLAEIRPAPKYDRALANSCGQGLSDRTRQQAAILRDLHRQEKALEECIAQLMADPRFVPYRKVMARFGFGRRVEAMLLSEIYPIEMFFGPNGKPQIEYHRSRKTGKRVKAKLSERRFLKALGVSPVRNELLISTTLRNKFPTLRLAEFVHPSTISRGSTSARSISV